jgi:diguanylate cyclase (GGDEF)-like protein
MLDLDDFKRINDRWGHATGDTVLKVLVETLVMNIRKTDYVVRLGGDEFMVILFSCDLATAEKTARTLHNRITERSIFHAGGELRMDCSMGVGEVESARELDSRMEEIDRLLYFAKRTGKGKVVSDRSSEIPSTILAE